jgi:hypothetical protein
MQISNNMSSSQAVVSGMSNLPDVYKTPLHLTQPSNTNQFVGNQVQFTNAVPMFSLPMQQQQNNPSVGLNSVQQIIPGSNAGNLTSTPIMTPTTPTQFQFATTPSPVPNVHFPAIFAPQAFFQPTMVPIVYPTSSWSGGNENNICMAMHTPPVNSDPAPQIVPTIPAPAGYVSNVSPMQIDDSGQHSPGLPTQQPAQGREMWKSDPAQTPPVQQVIAIPNYSQPGTYFLQTPEGMMVDLSKPYEMSNDTNEVPSRSVDSGDASVVNNATIQNYGNVNMEFMPVPQTNKSSNNQQLNQNNFNVQMNLIKPQPKIHLTLPQQNSPAMMPSQNNYTEKSSSQRNNHRDRSRSKKERSPPGFLDGYEIHRVQNVARENQNNFSQAPNYSDDVRRNGQQSRRRDRTRANDYGRRTRTHPSSLPVPMVNVARQNKRPRKENKKGGNKTTKRRTKRYGYRTKQDKIEQVYARVTEYFSELGVLVPEDHGVRGETVARVHIKKWLSLVKIEEAIARVQEDPRIKTVRVSAPLSMKNQYQKKGFLIYWETETVEGFNHLVSHFKSYDEKDEDGNWKLDEFQKISVAVQNDLSKYPNTETVEQETSSSIEITDSKASPAYALDSSDAKPTPINTEVQVSFENFMSAFAKASAANKPTASMDIEFKKPVVPDLEKMAFDDEEDAFGDEDPFATAEEKIAPPMFMKMTSNCSICSIGA